VRTTSPFLEKVSKNDRTAAVDKLLSTGLSIVNVMANGGLALCRDGETPDGETPDGNAYEFSLTGRGSR
jgi:hypothetical protein